jgi:Tol biopolymer transport system component
MKTFYALRNKNKHHKQDPDYFVFLPKTDENAKSRLVGKIYKNRGKDGTQFLNIVIFGDENKAEEKG